MITVGELKADGMAVISKIKNKDAFKESLNYIDFLASQSGISDTSGLKLPLTLCGGETEWTFTKKDINKIFFEWSEGKEDERKKSFDNPKIKAFIDNQAKTRTSYLESSIRNDRDSSESYAREFNIRMSRVMRNMQEIELLKCNPGGVLEDLYTNTFFRFHDYASLNRENHSRSGWPGPCLQFITPEIVMIDRDESAGRNITVNLGSFMMAIANDFRIFVLPHKNNVFAHGYFHPHVSRGGLVCYGDQSNKIDEAIDTRKLRPILEAVQGVLTQYNPGSPFMQLYEFEHSKDRRDQEMRIESTQPMLDAEEDECMEDEDYPGF